MDLVRASVYIVMCKYINDEVFPGTGFVLLDKHR